MRQDGEHGSHAQPKRDRKQPIVAFHFYGFGRRHRLLVDRGAQQRREDQRQRKLNHCGEDHGRDQRIEDAAEYAAKRYPKIELRQAADIRPAAGKLTVTHQGNRKQNQQIKQNQSNQWKCDLEGGRNECNQDEKRHPPNQTFMRNRRPLGEDQHKAQQVKRQR